MGSWPKQHWEQIYRTRAPEDLSWFQPRPEISLQWIAAAGLAPDAAILDVGGGASRLVDCLLAAGYSRLAVLDISGTALALARRRLGRRAAEVEWFEADVAGFEPSHHFDLWHDRAVFHFLTTASQRAGYVAAMRRALAPQGQAIVATFAPDGPEQCSGLPVARYDAANLLAALGAGFRLLEQRDELHHTPRGAPQHFLYFRLALQTDERPKVRS